MKLTIITINRNNAVGLKKTMESVFAQTSKDFEYIVVDGNSDDNSVEIINQLNQLTYIPFNYISESDTGIYNAINKGIRMAQGEYVQFLNSGDCLVSPDVTEKMLNSSLLTTHCSILYGNMLKQMPTGKILRDKGFAGRQPTMLDFYIGTLNHSSAYIQRSLFEKYGLYDETLRIVSDWKWYLQAIIFGGEQIEYVDVDITLFDMQGISNINSALDKAERKQVLAELLPEKIVVDYEKYAFPINQWERVNRYWLTRKCFWCMERGLFKWEKIKSNKKLRK